MRSEGSRRSIWTTIGLIILVVILFVVFLDMDKVLSELQGIDWQVMLVATAFLLVGYLLISVRWRYILANRPEYLTTLNTDSASFMTTILTPVPAIALRVSSIVRATPVTYVEAIPGMAVERFMDLNMRILALLNLILLMTGSELSIQTVVAFLAITGLILGAVLWIALHAENITDWISGLLTRLPNINTEQVGNSLSGFAKGISSYGSTKRLFVALLLSLLMWTFFLFFQYLGWLAIDVRLTNAEMLTLALAVLVVAPPSAPAMPVIYQSVVVAFLAIIGITNAETNMAYAIIIWVVQLVCWLVLGIWGLKRTDLKLDELMGKAQEALGSNGHEASGEDE